MDIRPGVKLFLVPDLPPGGEFRNCLFLVPNWRLFFRVCFKSRVAGLVSITSIF